MLNKKAAMFGLDARIALAIFGALSVITGAALYSAIGNAKGTAIVTEMQEMGKAWEAYYLDTGENLERFDSDVAALAHYQLKTKWLVENPGVAGWKGPYMSLIVGGSEYTYFEPNLHADIGIFTDAIGSVSWSSPTSWCNDSSDKCFIWVLRWYITDLSLIQNMDKKIDNGDGKSAGNFRWVDYSIVDNPRWQIALKVSAIKNPN